MKQALRNLGNKFWNGGGFFTFFRAQLTSNISGATDFIASWLLFRLGMHYGYATLLGVVCGGVVNFVLNYNWTFKAMGVKKWHVILKFAVVWLGSLLLNWQGTIHLTEWAKANPQYFTFLESVSDDIFLIVKFLVSILVGFTWNYLLNKYFVFRNVEIRKIVRMRTIFGNDTSLK